MKQSKIHRLALLTMSILILSAAGSSACGDLRQKPDETADSSQTLATDATASIEPSTTTVLPTQVAPKKKTLPAIDLSRSLSVFPGQRNVAVMGNGNTYVFDGIVWGYHADPSGFSDLSTFASIYALSDPVQFSVDRSVVAMMLDDGPYDVSPYFSFSETGRLVIYDGETARDIAAGVYSFQISSDGQTVVYLSASEATEEAYSMYLWSFETGESTLLTDRAGTWYTLSMDATAIAYTQIDITDPSLILYVNGETKKLAEDMLPVAVSNEGTYVYAIQEHTGRGDRLWAFYDGEQELITEHMRNRLYFSWDGTKILAETENDILYFQVGEEPVILEKDYGRLNTFQSYPAFHQSFWEQSLDSSGTQVSSSVYRTSFYMSNDLCDITFTIGQPDPWRYRLWYFTDQLRGKTLPGLNVNWHPAFVGDSVFVHDRDRDQLIFIEDLYADESWGEQNERIFQYYDLDDSFAFLGVTSDKTVVTTDWDEFLYLWRPTDPENEITTIPASMIQDAYYTDYFGSSVFHRENQPDLIFYKAYEPPQSDDQMSKYISGRYFTLYVVEDLPGATPQKVAENVSALRTGEFGVYYVSLVKVSSDAVNYAFNPYDYSDEGIFDQNAIYYSSDGMNFEYVADTYQRYVFGS